MYELGGGLVLNKYGIFFSLEVLTLPYSDMSENIVCTSIDCQAIMIFAKLLWQNFFIMQLNFGAQTLWLLH